MLNRIWVGFFIVAFIAALHQCLILGNTAVFEAMMTSVFTMSKVTVEIAIGLVGVLSFWLGMMKIAEHAGIVAKMATWLAPLFHRLMPDVPKGHPAVGSITMNLSANFLGLDNAATPLGLKAMQDLQSLNPNKDTASNAQILFLVLNTSSVTLFPVTVFVYRAQQGAQNPTDVFIPILLATLASTLAGLLAVAWVQKIPLIERTLMMFFASIFALIFAMVAYFGSLGAVALAKQSALFGNAIIFMTLIAFIGIATFRKVDVYERFIEGAKEGFDTSIRIIPYLLAMLCAIGVLRASGALDVCINAIAAVAGGLGLDTQFVDALPTAFMKPLSGSGARAMMVETMATHGADSFAGRLVSVIQGSTETTFYVLAVYFGSVGIRYGRHAVACGLLADIAGITAAITVCYWFFS